MLKSIKKTVVQTFIGLATVVFVSSLGLLLYALGGVIVNSFLWLLNSSNNFWNEVKVSKPILYHKIEIGSLYFIIFVFILLLSNWIGYFIKDFLDYDKSD